MNITRILLLCNIFASLLLSGVAQASFTYKEGEACQQKLKETLRDKQFRKINGCPVTQTLITWIAGQQEDSSLSFQQMKSFIEGHPHFPALRKINAYAEKKMGADLSSHDTVLWFQNHPPVGPDGAVAYARALKAQGQTVSLATFVPEAWRDTSLMTHHNKKFMEEFGDYLSVDDHLARLDSFLWEGNVESAQALLDLVPSKHQKIAKLRMGLLQGKQGSLAEALTYDSSRPEHEGLFYEVVKAYHKDEMMDKAAKILSKVYTSPDHGDAWWKERHAVAREFLKQKRYGEALAIIENHKLTKGENFSAAEWMTGWLNLRFLNEPQKALGYFTNMYENVNSPISKSRGAYWAGRAEEAQGNLDQAENWYTKGAQHKTAFYGQLSAAKLEEPLHPTLHDKAPVATHERSQFADKDLVKAAQLLSQAGSEGRYELRKFMWHIADTAEDQGARQLAVELATHIAPHDVVWSVKKANKTEHVALKSAFPMKDIPQRGQRMPEISLVHAFIYQESRFDPHETSSAGAKGLMQLMPETAAREAKILQVSGHHTDRLTQDPSYNMVLGSNHIARLLEQLDGSYVLTIAAYNAGKAPVDRWLQEYGDPRRGEIDIIDWIELIPYFETRNYVQRVLENLTVYRSLHGESTRTLIHDLVQ